MTETNTDRHPKWTRVEPGTVIPAGQPYRWEHNPPSGITRAAECVEQRSPTHTDETADWFVDSSWKPPLVLPTEPTWGIAMVAAHTIPYAGKWVVEKDGSGTWFKDRQSGVSGITTSVTGVVDFIPLTDEQVQRIEAAR